MSKKKPSAKPKSNGRATSDKKPSGCYVLSLSVENVRCFGPKQVLDCSDGEGRPRQWTVILGDNGTGKTTLLSMIEMQRFVSTELPFPYFLRDGLRRSECRVSLCLSTIDGTPLRTETAYTHGELRADFTATPDEDWADPMFDGSTESLKYQLRPHCYGLSRSHRHDTLYPSSGTVAEPFSAFESAELLDPERWLVDLDYAARSTPSENQKRWQAQVTDLLLKVLPGVSDLRPTSGSGVFPQPRVLFKTEYGWVPLRQLGHGYQTMIAWVVDFVSRMVERYPDSPNPLAEPAVCLVDEIDLHLHPVWQRKVIGYLSERFPNTQFIVTAHSPLVVQAAASADANIAVLVRSEKPAADGHHYVEIRNNPEDVRDWRLDQILTSDLFGGLSLNSPKVEDLFKEKEHLVGLKRLTPTHKVRLAEIEAVLAKLPDGDDAREVKEMQAIRDALDHLQKRTAK